MTDQWFRHLQYRHRKGVKEKGRLRQHTIAQDHVRELQWEQACDASSVVRDLLHFVA
jgi:hypothetical protein